MKVFDVLTPEQKRLAEIKNTKTSLVYPHKQAIFKSKEAHPEIFNTFGEEIVDAYQSWNEKTTSNLEKFEEAGDDKNGHLTNVCDALNDYLAQTTNVWKKNKDNMKPQGKLLTTILEEFVLRLFSIQFDTKYRKYGLKMGPATCIIGAMFDLKGKSNLFRTKDVDFAIYKEIKDINVPLVGLELKAYVDKTMESTIEHTFLLLRDYLPNTLYGFVCEEEARDESAVKSSRINNGFVLRNSKRMKKGTGTKSAIHVSEVCRLYKTITDHMNQIIERGDV